MSSLGDPLRLTEALTLRNRLVATAHGSGAAPDGVPQTGDAEYPGDHRGHDGFVRFADAVNIMWEIVSDLDLTFLDAGETRVVVLVAFDVMTRQTGVPLRLRLVEVYTVRDGRIADPDVYYRDTAAIVEADRRRQGPVDLEKHGFPGA